MGGFAVRRHLGPARLLSRVAVCTPYEDAASQQTKCSSAWTNLLVRSLDETKARENGTLAFSFGDRCLRASSMHYSGAPVPCCIQGHSVATRSKMVSSVILRYYHPTAAIIEFPRCQTHEDVLETPWWRGCIVISSMPRTDCP